MADVKVTIIAYSQYPSKQEIASFIQCITIFKNHNIHIVCPESLNINVYDELCKRYSCDIIYQRFADEWFASISSYNRLMLSPVFYERFTAVKHILIYQLDAWVFFDALDDWCARGYDYIGAPWFCDKGELLPFAGNGGFCLRNPRACLKVLTDTSPATWDYTFLFRKFPEWRDSINHFREILGYRFHPQKYIERYTKNEDFLFVKLLSATAFSVAPPADAALFSFERFPEKLYAMTQQRLPFGCHAFSKYNPAFWRKWIPCIP